MKKILLGTTALAAAAALTSPAFAADKVKLSLGGYYAGFIGYVDGSSTGTRDIAFGSDSEVHFKGKTTLDNGINVGFKAELELEDDPDRSGGGTADVIDEVYIDFSGGYGMVQFGQNDGVSSELRVNTPMAHMRIAADDIEDVNIFGSPSTTELSTAIETELGDSDATKIKYVTPRIAGFQAGISYAPENAKSAQGLNPRVESDDDEQLDFGVNYEFEANDVSFEAAFGYWSQQREAPLLSTEDDADHFNVGASVGFGGFTFGGNYTWGDNLGPTANYDIDDEGKLWSVGLTWGNGPWTLGAQYASAKIEGMGVGDVGEDDHTAIIGGVSYEVGPGIQIGAGVQYGEEELQNSAGVTTTDRDATAFFIETGLKF